MQGEKWLWACLAALGLTPSPLTATDQGIATFVVESGAVAHVSGLPALDPATGLLLLQDPPDVSGTSDCWEVCGMDVATSRITTQWALHERVGAKPAMASTASLRDALQATSFFSLSSLLPDQGHSGGGRRFAGPEAALIFDTERQHVQILAPPVLRRTVPLARRKLACDDDPETGERNVVIVANASDLQAWTHTETQLVLLRVVYLGNDQACTHAEWHVVRPNRN